MDERTQQYYVDHADALATKYESVDCPFAAYIPAAFPRGARILDIGAGTGRDAAHLQAAGYDTYAVEPVRELRDRGLASHPELADRLWPGHLPDSLPSLDQLGGKVDGILCSAVLQHLPWSRLFDAVFALKGILRERGRALVSVPLARSDTADERDHYGRLFTHLPPEQLELLFERVGFLSIGRWQSADALARDGVTWATLLFELRTDSESRPLDAIEAVLSTRERKVATYKLALIRALCDIALTQPHLAHWRSDRRVAIPMAAVAHRWVLYYWPLLTAPRFVPQMNGEWDAQHHKLAFASELQALAAYYSGENGLTSYAVDQRNGTLPPEAQRLEARALGKLARTIKEGPVRYAGGALRSTSSSSAGLFAYERGHILVAAELWKELSLMGHWIQEALLLRWAEKSAELSRSELGPDDVIGLLLQRPVPERETDAARRVFGELPDLRCVWTGAALTAPRFDVDHVIPYSLWRNNDLWNLLPAHSTVNGKKSDRLPTRNLLHHCRPAIVDYWKASRDRFPARFDAESSAQVGARKAGPVPLDTLFDVLVEAVEVTALRRGCDRWQP